MTYMKKGVISADEAARLIKSNDTVIIGGSGGIGVAESILEALETRYLSS